MQQKRTVGEQMLFDRVKHKLDKKEIASAKSWKHPDGKLYRVLKVLYFISAIYSFLVLTINELVLFMLYGGKMTKEQISFFGTNRWIVHAMFILAITSFVCMIMKKVNLALRIQFVVGALIIFQITQVFTGLYMNKTVLATFYGFALLPFICAAVMLWVIMGYQKRLRIAVEIETKELYAQHCNEEQLLSDAQWQKVLEEHEAELKKK